MRMISDNSLLTIVPVFLSQSTGTVTRPLIVGPRLDIEFAQLLRAEDGIGNDARPRIEGPAALGQKPMDDRERDHALEPFEPAEDEGAVRPRAGERDDEVIAARLRLEAAGAARPGFPARGHPVAERRVGADEMAGRVVGEVAPRARRL